MDGTPLRTLGWIVSVAFAVQAGTTLAVAIDHRGSALEQGVRVFASERAIPGASAAVRVAVLDPGTGRGARFDRVELSSPAAAEVTAPEDMGDAFVVSHLRLGEAAGPVELRVGLTEGDAVVREVRAALHARRGPSWLDQRSTFAGRGSTRLANPSAASGDAPSITVRATRAGDACPWLVSAAGNGGVVALGLPNRVLVRVTDAAGAPRSDVFVRLERSEDSGSLRTSRTDALGVAEFDLTPGGTEVWQLGLDCDGTTVTRELALVPSWDGLVLQALRTVFTPGEPLGFSVAHQREWGAWHQDVHCDGAWLATQTTPVRAGTFGFPDLVLRPGPGDVELCVLQGYAFLMSGDPPRSVAYVLVAGQGVDEADAVGRVARAAALHGSAALRGQLGEETLDALAAAPADSVSRFGRWLLDSLPQRFVELPLLVDDMPAARSEFAAAHARRARKLGTALAVDGAVVVAAVLCILVPGVRRQRAALARASEDVESGAELALDGGWRAGLAVGLGIAALAASLLGIALLMAVLR